MKIHGLRIYRSGLFRLFSPLAEAWRDCTFANDFDVSLNADLTVRDPMPTLRRQYGSAVIDVDVNRQLFLLRGDAFPAWGATLHPCEGAWLPAFSEVPSFEQVTELFWSRNFRLTADAWPTHLRALLQMWDGVYWQLFTTERSDIDTLIGTHGTDPISKMFVVDLDREHPDPSNAELQPATLGG